MIDLPDIFVAHYHLIPQVIPQVIRQLMPQAMPSLISQESVGLRWGMGRGALLKFQWNSDRIGYADCFPWPELGDAALGEQLAALKKREMTPLLARSIYFAKLDAAARFAGKSLWSDAKGRSLVIPKSHAFMSTGEACSVAELEKMVQSGFQFLKIKLGSDLLNEVHHIRSCIPFFLEHGLRIRFDLNARASFDQLSTFLNTLGPNLEWIDFIEDPCPFEMETWALIQKRWRVRLALDRLPSEFRFETILDRSAISVFILKPAIQDPKLIFQEADRLQMPVVVTSYLDHPLGQVCAAWVAAERLQSGPQYLLETCGLVSHVAYKATPFSEQLGAWGPQLSPPIGTGFGFDALLREQQWEAL